MIIPLSTRAQQNDCRKLDVIVDITHSSGGQKGSIKVTTKEEDVKISLHLLTPKLKDRQQEITSGTIKDIPPGTYSLVIHCLDAKYCSETRTVTVN